MDRTQHGVASRQFGNTASNYVTSAVHAQGADLDWIEQAVRGKAEAHILDLGCGGGHVSYRVAPHVAHVTACDLSDKMLAVVAKELEHRGIGNVALRQSPAEALPFNDQCFDMVLCRFSAHHWADLDAGLGEIARVLQPHGRLLMIDGCSPGVPLLDTHLQTIEVLRDPSHVRDYSAAEWIGALARAGLKPKCAQAHTLRMEFASWVERMQTADVAVQAIRYLQSGAAQEIVDHFAIEPDSSFLLDTIWVEATKS